MDLAEILVFARVVLKELWINKFKVVIGGGLVAFSVFFIGMMVPTTYQTSMTMFADNQNILKPLLDKQAAVSKVQDQVRVVRDVMMSPRMLTMAAEKLSPDFSTMTPDQQEEFITHIRRDTDISSPGKSYIKVSYTDSSPSRAYNTINTLTDLFIKDSAETQRSNSREAFEFIDGQVRQYKEQLVNAESKLKAFHASNTDGTAANVNARITKLRGELEELTLTRDEQKIRISSLEKQLKEENRFTTKQYKADVYRERLAQLKQQKENLLLTYKEDYPDVVALTLQIQDMEKAIAAASESDSVVAGSESTLNPLYSQLRSKLSDAKVDLYTTERRLEAIKHLVDQENGRRKRIASRDAELAELTRDYTVTKKIYEEMLEKKEKARMSMTLSIEGQGVTYKVQEPAKYPLTPTGITFRYFAVIGLVAGILVPIACVVLYIVLDPRIRFVKRLSEVAVDVPILAKVPHTPTMLANRIIKSDMILMVILIVVMVAAYIALTFGHHLNWY